MNRAGKGWDPRGMVRAEGMGRVCRLSYIQWFVCLYVQILHELSPVH